MSMLMMGKLVRLLLIMLLIAWLLTYFCNQRQKQAITIWINKIAVILIMMSVLLILVYILQLYK
ncbi:MAG: hypothetical protein J6568_07185 [Snodgrassella sp.]|nr:hypothetical protein [Snodgrassella sp.]